jgi:hypothetical protein
MLIHRHGGRIQHAEVLFALLIKQCQCDLPVLHRSDASLAQLAIAPVPILHQLTNVQLRARLHDAPRVSHELLDDPLSWYSSALVAMGRSSICLTHMLTILPAAVCSSRKLVSRL